MTTTEELIAHPDQVVCGELGPDTVPWSREEMLVAIHDVTPDEAALIVADQPTAVIQAVRQPVWPTEDSDTPTELIAVTGKIDLPVVSTPSRTGRHRLRRRTPAQWCRDHWTLLLLVFVVATASAITSALATYWNIRPVLTAGAVTVVVSGLTLVWLETSGHRSGRDVR